MKMPLRTRVTILIFAVPGLIDEYWLGNRFLDLPGALRRAGLISVELAMLLLLLALVMWSFTARKLTSGSAVFLFGSAVLMGGGGALRLLLVLADPTGDPLLKPHLFEVGGLVFAAMMIGIEGQAARRYFEKMRRSQDGETGSPA
ncbi:MAG: hypothetical protein M1313_09345 [Nitrospirae bacterium]|nr:hypothetical protein [Nitrospirota bacterium]